jgi:hypothetical protein
LKHREQRLLSFLFAAILAAEGGLVIDHDRWPLPVLTVVKAWRRTKFHAK